MPNVKPRATLTAPKGFRVAGGAFGIKPSGRPDMALIVADAPCSAAGVFTRNRAPGAPVTVGKRHLRACRARGARAIVCNSGVSNVATGRAGLDDALAMCREVAKSIGADHRQVFPASTGVIGKRLPMDKISRGVATLLSKLDRGADADADAARAILTTDLVPKQAHRRFKLGDKTVHLGGVAKGSGMIAPDMATMLSFITTDAAVEPEPLQRALREAVGQSFNRISVDMDTSTSDTVLLLANGAAGGPTVTGPGRELQAFTEALCELCRELAYKVVADGEGATRVFRVAVSGARTEKDADRVGRAVVNSPLVKTAVHGGDPNWGRLLMAIGRSGAAVDLTRLRVTIGGLAVFERGGPAETAPSRLVRAMRRREVAFGVDLGLGGGAAEWLGCDLSREYVAINADYTT